jgi:hypothetical protein
MNIRSICGSALARERSVAEHRSWRVENGLWVGTFARERAPTFEP